MYKAACYEPGKSSAVPAHQTPAQCGALVSVSSHETNKDTFVLQEYFSNILYIYVRAVSLEVSDAPVFLKAT